MTRLARIGRRAASRSRRPRRSRRRSGRRPNGANGAAATRRPARDSGRDRRACAHGGNAFDAAVAAASRARRRRALQLRHRRRRLHGDPRSATAAVSRRSTRARRRRARCSRPASSSTARPPTDAQFYVNRYSGLSAGVPGTPYAWSYLLRHYGTSSSARRSPRARSRATASPSTRRSSTRPRRTRPYFDDIPSSAALYLDADGTPRDVGTTVRNPDLAKTYERMGRRRRDRRLLLAARSPTRWS